MTETKRTMDTNFTALLDRETSVTLDALAAQGHLSKAAVVRNLIRGRGGMVFGKQPICADGGSCRCPHAHIYGPALPAAPPDPDKDI